MAGSLILSVIIILIDRAVDVVELREWWEKLVDTTDMTHVFLDGLLAFMLFAGSPHVDMDSLREWRGPMGTSRPPVMIGLELLTEAGGGIALGLLTGCLAYRALHLIDEPALELSITLALITLALVTVTYSLAAALHVSARWPSWSRACGHRSTRFAMTDLSASR